MEAPLQMLKEEHRTIKKVLDALDGYVESVENSPQQTDQRDLLRFVEFLQLFADSMHHGKEEDILFERMEAMGFPKESGPLAVMYFEHDRGREFVAELKALGELEGQWSDSDRNRLSTGARGYTELLRNHIHKEDNILYPMAESGLAGDAWDLVAGRFEQFENTAAESGEKDRLQALATELVATYAEKAS